MLSGRGFLHMAGNNIIYDGAVGGITQLNLPLTAEGTERPHSVSAAEPRSPTKIDIWLAIAKYQK